MHSRVAWFAIVAIGFACTGCQSARGNGPANPTQPQTTATPAGSTAVRGPMLSGTVSISGAASIATTHFAVSAQMENGQDQVAPPSNATCAAYANGFASTTPPAATTGFVAPMLHTNGYHNIYIGVTMASGYHGPGTYSSARASSIAGTAVEGIGASGSAVYTVFRAGNQGATTLTVHADGSGSLTITHWHSDEVRQAPGASQVDIDGVVTWTCSL